MSKLARLTCVLALGALALSAQTATAVVPTAQTTGMVGIADAQTAQLNLLNPGVEAPGVGAPCIATASFVDANGVVLKTTILLIAPGKSSSFLLRSDADLALVAGDRREIRAVISAPAILPPGTAASVAIFPACHLIPTLEILDTVSGRTLVVLGHVEAVPSVVAVAPAPAN